MEQGPRAEAQRLHRVGRQLHGQLPGHCAGRCARRSRSRISCTSCRRSTRSSAARGASAGKKDAGAVAQDHVPAAFAHADEAAHARPAAVRRRTGPAPRPPPVGALARDHRQRSGRARRPAATKLPSASISHSPSRGCQTRAGTRSVTSTARMRPGPRCGFRGLRPRRQAPPTRRAIRAGPDRRTTDRQVSGSVARTSSATGRSRPRSTGC
jgi:hypothetical protein